MTDYQVIGPVVNVKVPGAHGMQVVMLQQHAILPPGVSPEQIRHLLSVRLIAPVVQPAHTPAAPAVDTEPPANGPEVVPASAGASLPANDVATGEGPAGDTPAASDADVEAQRAEARTKLDAAGGVPNGRHGQAVWVEFLVRKGYDYDAVKGESKEALQQLAGNIENR